MGRRALVLSLPVLLLWLAGCGPNIAEQFEKAKADGTVEALDSFESANPENPYEEEIITLKEEIRFKEAMAEGTPKALEAFVKEFPDSGKEAEAKEALDELRWKEASEGKTVKLYRKYLKRHPKGKHVDEAREAFHGLLIDRLKQPKTPLKRFRAFLKKKSLTDAHRDQALRVLQERIEKKAADAGVMGFVTESDGKRSQYDWVEGYAGSRTLEINAAKLKLPETLKWKAKKRGKKVKVKGPAVKGKLALTLVGDELSADPVHAVAVVVVGDKAVLASKKVKLKAKKVNKKKGGKAKVKLSWPELPELASGKAKLHLMLVQGEVPGDAKALKPISNIVSQDVELVVPELD